MLKSGNRTSVTPGCVVNMRLNTAVVPVGKEILGSATLKIKSMTTNKSTMIKSHCHDSKKTSANYVTSASKGESQREPHTKV